MSDLQQKSLDMEGRKRMSNIRILNVPEDAGSDPSFVIQLLKEVFSMDKDVVVDRSHRIPLPANVKGKPCAIIRTVWLCTSPVQPKAWWLEIQKNYPFSMSPDYVDICFGVMHPAKLCITYKKALRETLWIQAKRCPMWNQTLSRQRVREPRLMTDRLTGLFPSNG